MKIKWQPIVKIKGSLLFQWYIFEGGKKKHCHSSLGLNFGFKNSRMISGEISIDINEFAKLEKILTSKIKSDKNYLQEFINRCCDYSHKLINTSKQIKAIKNWKIDNGKLLTLYLKYQDSILSLTPFLNAVLVIDNILKREIVNLLEADLKIKNKNEQDLLISKLIIPKKKSFFVQETEALLKMAVKLQENPQANISQEINYYLKKYAWMSSISYLGKFQTEEKAVQKIKNLVKENPKQKLQQAKQIKKETQADYEKAYNEIEKSKRLVSLVNYAREFIYLQTYRLDVFFLAHYYAYPLLEEIGKRFGLSVDEIVYLTGEEIVNFLKGISRVKKKELHNRISDYVLILEDEKWTLLSGNQVKKTISKVAKELTVKGTVANRGRATGKAKLLHETEDISKVNRGDIIVSPMTRPELVPAIVKASGIITDFGGMLSHAAIISREFGVPCIVGTKKATKVFKDGDLVELNAYDGTARKLQ